MPMMVQAYTYVIHIKQLYMLYRLTKSLVSSSSLSLSPSSPSPASSTLPKRSFEKLTDDTDAIGGGFDDTDAIDGGFDDTDAIDGGFDPHQQQGLDSERKLGELGAVLNIDLVSLVAIFHVFVEYLFALYNHSEHCPALISLYIFSLLQIGRGTNNSAEVRINTGKLGS